jgi:hypothetical protein
MPACRPKSAAWVRAATNCCRRFLNLASSDPDPSRPLAVANRAKYVNLVATTDPLPMSEIV